MTPRNDAIHGRSVSGARAQLAITHARSIVAVAHPLPHYDDQAPTDRYGASPIDSTASPDELFEDGFNLFAEGQIAGAAVIQAAAHKLDGNAVLWLAHDWLEGTIESESGQHATSDPITKFIQKALSAMTRTKSMDDEGIGQAHLLQGHILRRLGEEKEARREFRAAARRGSEGAEVQLQALNKLARLSLGIRSIASGSIFTAARSRLADLGAWSTERDEPAPPDHDGWIHDPTGWLEDDTSG